MKKEVKLYKTTSVTFATEPDSVFFVKGLNETVVRTYITTSDGQAIPLKDLSGGGGGSGIEFLASSDSSIAVTGTTTSKNIQVSSALQALINSALQSGDSISTLINDSGYITLADVPTFNPSDYDLSDFTNTSLDPFVKQSEITSGATNLGYTASPTNGIVTSDTGSDATIPLADLTNAGLLSPAEKGEIATAVQPSDLGAVSTSNDYGDLDNIPTSFPPSTHTHVEADITDLDKYTQSQTDTFLNNKVDNVVGKGLSEEDYTTVEKTKLSSIESGAEVNNISDVNATDLTDSGDTTLHTHDSRYYTETEVDSLIKYKDLLPVIYEKHTNVPIFGSASLNNLEGVAFVLTGATSRAFADTGIYTRRQRLGLTVAVTNNLAQARQLSTYFNRNSSLDIIIGLGFAENCTNSNVRAFAGISANTLFTNIEPTALINCVGIAKLTTSNNLHVIHNDGSGTATAIDLGASFPSNTIATDFYIFIAETVGSDIDYLVIRVNTGDTTTGTITTDLPSPSTALNLGYYVVQNTGANTTTGIDFFGTNLIKQ